MNQPNFLDYTPDEPEKQPRQNTGNHPDPMEQVQPEKPVETGTALVSIEKVSTALVFQPGGADPLIERIKKEALSLVPDISTQKGREAIASLAWKISRAKTFLDDAGKTLKEELQVKIDPIDAERRKIRAELDALKEEIRKPLTDWENKEKERVANLETAFEALSNMDFFLDEPTAAQLADRIREIEAMNRDWQEFADRAANAKDVILKGLRTKHEARVKYEADQAELEQHRREKAEAEAYDALWNDAHSINETLAKAAREAAEKARQEAEAIAAVNLTWEEAHRENAEFDRQAAWRREREAVERAESIAWGNLHSEAWADNRAFDAKIQADRDAKDREEAAAQRERDRQAQAQKAEDDAKAAREANLEYRKKINNAALAEIMALIDCTDGGAADKGRAIIGAIAQGKIPNVTINY